MDKSICQHKHAQKRFAERYGFNFNRHVKREFVRLIQTHQTTLIERQSHRISIHDIYHNDHIFRVVYDKHRKSIVTVFPPEALEENKVYHASYSVSKL